MPPEYQRKQYDVTPVGSSTSSNRPTPSLSPEQQPGRPRLFEVKPAETRKLNTLWQGGVDPKRHPNKRSAPMPIESITRPTRRYTDLETAGGERERQGSVSVPIASTAFSARKTAAHEAPEPQPKVRKFAVHPVESSQKSSRDKSLSDFKAQPRKFAVEPVETSKKSSRDKSDSGEVTQPRKFAVEPVETSQKSSKDRTPSNSKPQPRRFAVEPVETSQKNSKDRGQSDMKPPPRKFAVEPVEASQKSSKDKNMPAVEKLARVRFLPEPVETTHRTSKFAPQPVETTHRSNRSVQHQIVPASAESTGNAPRKFTPILLDTAKRSHRANAPSVGIHTKGVKSEYHLHAREHRRHIRGSNTPLEDDEVSPSRKPDLPAELRRQLAPLDGSRPTQHRPSFNSVRSHSFRCPDLDTIASSESDGMSNVSSRASSPGQSTPFTASDSSFTDVFKHATRVRESVDETFAQYLRQLEAKKAEQRMQMDALATAFPNSDYHEPVTHYVNDDASDDYDIEERPGTWEGHEEEDLLASMAARRESTGKVTWEQQEMQRHAEKLQQERNAMKTTAKQPTESQWWKPDERFAYREPIPEVASKEKRVRPPMLGADLTFPRCPSPEPANFSDLHEEIAAAEGGDDFQGEPRLWQGRDRSESGDEHKGLWGGFCYDKGESTTMTGSLAPSGGRSGLMTPWVEPATNPFEQSFAVPSGLQPTLEIMTPPAPTGGLRETDRPGIDDILSADNDLDSTISAEYPDSFITQVYNYLSLGYPSLARPFDYELAKISQIPVAELRQDDEVAKAQPKGYIRLGNDFEGGGGHDMVEVECVRWRALRLYVREWVRQEEGMAKAFEVGPPEETWGAGVRRGSWAI